MKKTHPIEQFLDHTKDLIWIVDRDLKLVYANKAYQKVMREVTGAEKKLNTSIITEGFGEGYIQKWKAYYQRALAGEDFEVEEHYYNPESEDTQYGHVSFTAIRNEEGEVESVSCRSADITLSLKKATRASQLMDASLDVFCTVNEDGNFTYVSAQSESLWGYTPEELIDTPYVNLIVEEDIPKTNEIAEKIISGQNVTTFTNRYKRKDGEIAHNIWSASWDDESKTMHCVARDGKEQIKKEKIIFQSEQRFKALVVEGGDLIGILNTEGLYTYVSPTSTSVLGMEPEEFIGRSPFDFIHPEDCERVQDCLEKIFTSKKVTVEPFRFKNSRNQWRWIETILTNMIDNPAVKGVVANSRDVTEKVEENHHLKLLQSVITNTKDAVLITEAEPFDEPGPRIIYVNEAFTEMTGYTAEEVIGKTPRILHGPNSNYEELARLGKSMRNWESCEATTINYKKNGEEFWSNFKLTPVADETGWYTHWILIERDVTEEKNKELEKELLAQISLIFNENPGLSQIGSLLTKTISDFGRFDLVEFWQPNLVGNEMFISAQYTLDKEDEQFYTNDTHLNRVKKSQGLPGKVWEIGKRVLLKDIAKSGFLRKKAAKKIDLKSILGIPLIENNQVVGVLLIGSKRGYDHFDKFLPFFNELDEYIGSEIKRKQLESELKRLVDSIPVLITTSDFQGRFIQINRAGCELIGFSHEEIIHQSFEKFIHPDDLEKAHKALARVISGESVDNFEVRFITKSSTVNWVSYSATPDLKSGLIYSTAKDITEEKRLRELNRQAGKLAKIGGWELDLETMTPHFSEEVFRIYEIPFGSPPKLEDGISFYIPEARPIIEDAVYQAIENNIPYELELPFITAKGKSIWVKTHGMAEVIDGKAVKLIGAIQDITDRKVAEMAVRESEAKFMATAERLRLATTTANIGIWDWDVVNDHLIWDESMYRIFGVAEDQFEGAFEAWSSTVHPEDIDKATEEVQNALNGHSKFDTEFRVVWPDKSIRYVTGNAIVIRDEVSGKPLRMIGSNIDITERKKAEQEILEAKEKIEASEAKFKSYTEKSPIAIYTTDVNGNCTYVNQTWLNMTGMNKKEALGDGWLNALHPEDLEGVKVNWYKSVESNGSWRFEYRFINKKNKEISWVEGTAKELFNDKNELIGFLGTNVNITERKRAEKENRFKANLLSMVGQAAIATDLSGIVKYWNRAAESIYGWAENEAIGKDIISLTTPKTSEEQAEQIMKLLRQGKTWSGEFMVSSKDGTNFPAHISNSPIYDENNKLSGIIGISSNISQEVLTKKLLEQYTLELERSNEELEQFAFITSHDLQEPLRMISSFMEQLKRKYSDQLDDKALQYIHFATDGAKRMKQIILDLLLYSRVNRPSEEEESVDLNTIIAEFLQLRRKLIAEKKAVVKYDQLPSLNTYRAPVTQIFHSLLDNALKYSREKVSPVISISVKETGKFYEFAVEDNGIGIDEKFYDKIFIIFQRLNNRADYDGTGIGLSVTKRAVEFLGGKIWVESVVGKGSTFYFTIKKT